MRNASESAHKRFPRVRIERLRLISGLILFSYVCTHFLNHALGLRSLATLEYGQALFLYVWRSYPGTFLLYLALAVHVYLALLAIYRRDRLATMGNWEITQLAIGLFIPLVLIQHVMGTRIAHELFELNDRYSYTMLVMWKYLPYLAWLQPVTLLLVWLHGCIGIHFWLRLKAGYSAWVLPLFAVAILIPILGLLGFIDAGLTALALTNNPDWEPVIRSSANALSEQAVTQINVMTAQTRILYLGIVIITFVLRSIRIHKATTHRRVSIRYDTGQFAKVPEGSSVLEASRSIGLPHASVCGGRGRCSTCRIRLEPGSSNSPPPDMHEIKVLSRVGAPPNVRLACQFRPTEPIRVTRLLPPAKTGPGDSQARPGYIYGEEKEIAILFADIRGFTRLSEQKLPYDVVFILNRYFSEMGQAVETAGGRLDKFVGDGVMALFGIERGPATGARNALAAARNMIVNLDDLNTNLSEDLHAPLQIGIGIHVGPAIVGEMGYGPATGLTAVGDTVNIASRLESATRELGATLLVSETISEYLGGLISGLPSRTLQVPGREQPVVVRMIHDPRKLDLDK